MERREVFDQRGAFLSGHGFSRAESDRKDAASGSKAPSGAVVGTAGLKPRPSVAVTEAGNELTPTLDVHPTPRDASGERKPCASQARTKAAH
jgi:hypothetical protein